MIKNFLIDHSRKKTASFHMPGHKGDRLYRKYGYDEFLDNIFNCDITEIPGADNLFQTEGIIRDTMKKYKELYEVDNSYLLINGTSGGLIAAMLASVPAGGKIIVARNCHKSVFNGLVFGNIKPVYAYPEIIQEYGISGAVSADEIDRLIDENSDVSAVILPSPNYYGICSDIKAIGDVCHKRGKILIVDQAHGAHLKFFSRFAPEMNMPLPAEECGADITVNSTHKTLLSLTQSAVLNLNSSLVDRYILEDKLQMIQSTSPSYILMASLDINGDILKAHGRELIQEWKKNLEMFYSQAEKIEGLKVMTHPMMDRTKINLDCGYSGNILEERLMEKGVFIELVTGNIAMAMTGIGNSEDDYRRLLQVISDVEKGNRSLKGDSEMAALWGRKRTVHHVPAIKERVPLDEAKGRICASSIIPYPPGIPFLCPGEEIGREEIEYIKKLRSMGEKVIGINDRNEVIAGEKK